MKQTPKERLRDLLCDDVHDLYITQADIENSMVEACVEFLLSRNYKVISPPSNDLNVNKIQDLRDRFYSLANRKYAGKYASMGRGNSMDITIMRNFVNSRVRDGVTRKVALLECAKIMETVFNYSEKMGIEGQITINMFDPGLFSWVVDKALRVINGEIQLQEDAYVEEIANKMCDRGMDTDSWAMFGEDD